MIFELGVVVFLSMLCIFATMSYPVSLLQLKTELIQAEQELAVIQQRIAYLWQDIAKRELALIREELDVLRIQTIEHKFSASCYGELAFQKQREVLTNIIHTVPKYREEAFHLLDEVLLLITNFRDKQDKIMNEEEEGPLRS